MQRSDSRKKIKGDTSQRKIGKPKAENKTEKIKNS